MPILKLLRRAIAVATVTAAAVALAPAPGTAAGPPTAIRPVQRCADLARVFAIPNATTHVLKATEVAATPAYCELEGYVEPAVGFKLRLPIDTYSGRYLQYGCDGLCGVVQDPAIRGCAPAGGDLAVASTDDGHVGQGGFPFNITDGTWAANDQAARDDYFFRAPHVVSVAAKQIITAYYGTPPIRSYFSGCSTGGREGLLLAQRYPRDFNGIVAGSPVNVMGPLIGMYHAWLAKMNVRPDGSPILTAEKLPALHNAVLTACDKLDGLVDGQIDDPRACRYDPGFLRCPDDTVRPTCLTPAQVSIVRQLYRGLTDAHGVRLYPGWESRGSELMWYGAIIPDPVFGSFLGPLPDNYLKYLGYPIGTPHSSLAGIRFTVPELRRLTPEGVKGNAMSHDLSAFRRAGGKLIVWHGWDDQTVPAVGTVDYYDRLTNANGGRAATQRFARLFMVPTKYHCRLGGYALTDLDPIPALIDWVERGDAPDRIIATAVDPNTHAVTRSRPVFPYPLRAAYDGTGSVDDADNFVAAPPLRPTADTIPWAGTDLYYRGGPVAP
jgi:Tannase and feruloyl esterase